MEFRILGPFEVADGDRTLVIGGGRQRKLLAILLLHANEIVGSERLIDQLWSEQRPETAVKALHGYISQLRKTLGHDVVRTRPGGYVLRIAPGELDAERFDQLVEEARDAEPRAAAAKLREALALWRGPALADFAYDDFARADVERLEERRFAALEQRIEADLALGRHADLVGELAALVAREPLRERLRAQLMLALYRSGRQVDALESYQQARRAFIDDLGLEPSEELQQLQRAILAHDPALGPAPRTVWPRARHVLRRPRVLAALGASLLVGAIGVAAIATLRGSDTAAALGTSPHTVAMLAAGSGELVAQVPLRDSAYLRFGEGYLWSISGDGRLVQIDPDSHAVTRSVAARVHPAGLAVGEDAIWVTDADSQTLLRIDGRYLTSKRFELPSNGLRDPGRSGGVAVGAGSVWVAHGTSEVLRVDPRNGQVRRRFPVPGAGDIVFADGAVWVESDDWSVTRIDPANDETSVPVKFHYLSCCVAAGGGFVWLVTRQDQTVWRFEPGGGLDGPLGSVKLRGDVRSLAYGDGALWATTGAAGTVVRIDPATDTQQTFRVGHATNGIAASNGRVAVGVSPSPADATAGLSGRVARFPMSYDWVGNTDPAVARGPYEWQLLYATCAKLYNHPDAPAPAGWRLEPEVAAGPPTVSADGRTYSIRIRRGYRFSPPSGEPVTAEAFRHSIERALSPELGPGADAIAYARDFAGVHDYRAGRTPRIAGIGAQGDTLTIRLIRPAPDLAARLALTYFCAVPPQTQIVRNGLAQPIPSAGPYYVASYLPDHALVVKRNPNYQGARPQRLDAMVYEIGIKDSESVRRIQRGEADVLEGYSMGPKGPLQSRYGRARDGQPQRFFLPDHLGTVYLAFNTRRALFSERRMRRAVNFALDRPVIAATYGYLPADHYLPPGMPGHARAHVFPTDGPDLARGRALTRGRRGRAVLYTCDVAFCKEWAQMIRRNLARIGIDVKARQFPDPIARARRKGTRADMLFTKMTASWPSSYPDPVTFLANVLETHGSADRIRRAVAAYCNCGTPRNWYDNAKLEARLERIGKLGGARREATAGALDLDLARDAPGAVLATETTSSFFSERVGCQTFQPLYFGVDIAALCLRQDG